MGCTVVRNNFLTHTYRVIVTTVPVYIAELSPKKLRGGFVTIMGVNVMGGILVGVAVYYLYAYLNM